MSNAAQDEVNLLFSHRDRLSAHPEDFDNSDRDSLNEKDTTEAAFSANPNDDTDDDDDFGISSRLSSLSTAKTTYTIPRGEQYANTGPKGVIADAQSYNRAKRSATRKTLAPMRNEGSHLDPRPKPSIRSQEKGTGLSFEDEDEDGEDEDIEDEDNDDEFMKQWRANKLAELSAETEARGLLNAQRTQQRRISPSRRAYGSVVTVDAMGYLDAVEKVSPETTVIVMLHDANSTRSAQVEDELDTLAYKYGHVRFVKMDHTEAEMEHIQIPALIAYRGGDVCATISGAKSEGLEKVLLQQRILE